MLKAFILAAGEASRFAPYSRLLEKSMLPLGGKPLVRIIAERLHEQFGFKLNRTYLCVLDKHEAAFKHEFRDSPWIRLVTFQEPVGTAGTYSLAAQQSFINDEDDILIHYADCYTDIDYGKMWDKYNEGIGGGLPAMIAISKNVHHDYSEVLFDIGTNSVIQMTEKPQLQFPTWTGIAIFNHGAFMDLKLQGDNRFNFDDFGYDVFPKWIKVRGLSAYMVDEPWYDVGNPRSYEQIRDSFTKAKATAKAEAAEG